MFKERSTELTNGLMVQNTPNFGIKNTTKPIYFTACPHTNFIIKCYFFVEMKNISRLKWTVDLIASDPHFKC